MFIHDLKAFLDDTSPEARTEFTIYLAELARLDTMDRTAVEKLVTDAITKGFIYDDKVSEAVLRRPTRTATTYDGPADERQGGAEQQVTRFRPRYRKLTDAELKLHDEIKTAATALESLYDQIAAPGRYKALAITALEESVMWAVKDLTK